LHDCDDASVLATNLRARSFAEVFSAFGSRAAAQFCLHRRDHKHFTKFVIARARS
jgi:hypothetical protein